MHKIFTKKSSIFIMLTVFTFLVYSLSFRGEGAHFNYFILLADAFNHGHLYVDQHPSWLNELVQWKDHYYVVYPPMPAVLLMPFVAIFGNTFNQPYLSIFLGSLNVGLSFLVLNKVFNKKTAILAAIAFGMGSMYWYTTEVGSAWYIAHIVAIFFLWLGLLELFTKGRLFIVGLCIGAAYLARLPAILMVVFVLIYQYERFIEFRKPKIIIHWRSLLLLGLGLMPLVLLNFLYNYLRFGVFHDIAYSLLPIFNEPWYQYGLFNVRYIPIHLKEMFTALPKMQTDSPYFLPSLHVLAIWFVTPILLIIPWAKFKDRIVWSAVLTVLIMALPSLLHGENGFAQFGFRFALDYFPILFLIVGSGIKNAKWWLTWILLILGVIINFWGVYFISILNLWTM